MKFIRRMAVWLAVAVVITSSLDGSKAAETVGSVIQEVRSAMEGVFGGSATALQRPGAGVAIAGTVVEVGRGGEFA